MTNGAPKAPAQTVLAAEQATLDGGAVITGSADGMQIVTVTPAANSAVHAEEITKAAAFAQERAEREARLQRPHVRRCRPSGVFTSGFGYRWGVLHGGIDIANSIGTPILRRLRRRRHRRRAHRRLRRLGQAAGTPTAP